MQAGTAAVIPLKKRQKILRQIVFVEVGQRTDDAEIKRDVSTGMRWIQTHQNIARVHLGMKKAVPKHLREKYFNAVARQPGKINATAVQRYGLTDRYALH